MNGILRSGAAVAAMTVMAGGVSGQEQPRLVIDGTSTVRSWTCEAESFDVATSPRNGFEQAVLSGEKALETVTLSFPVSGIECGNGTMNDHLRKALQADDHPEISYRLSRYAIEDADAGVAVSAEGELTIAGTARPITMSVTVSPGADGALRVRGEQVIDMTEFGVTPPKLMLGALKVGDTVKVRFDVALRAEGSGVLAAGRR